MTNHPNRSKRNEHVAEPFRTIVNAITPTITQQAKHTPGPWHSRKGYLVRGKYAGCIEIAPDNAPACALIPPGRDDVRDANARLIAAAPELLAALKALLKSAEEDDLGQLHECIQARAVIAKAERH